MLNILDQTVINTVNTIGNPLLDSIMIFFTSLGDNGIIWIIFSGILLIKKKTRNAGILIIISILTVSLITNNLKEMFDRIRPYEYMNFIPKIKTSGTSSFPSAHSSTAFAVFGISYFYDLKYKYIIGSTAFFIAVSRFYLEVHYFTDVLAGAVIGIAVAYILFLINKGIIKSLKTNNHGLLKKSGIPEKISTDTISSK
jgi:undecaprenyl-diphosphatase